MIRQETAMVCPGTCLNGLNREREREKKKKGRWRQEQERREGRKENIN
jgi:iron only hydrogenase large subunit-like protein